MNIIVEEMIGSPAPPLKDAAPSDPKEFFNLIVEQMRILYQDGNLIHGDLSSFNILNHEEKPFLIDFSQSTLVGTPNSEELLRRDIKNVIHYFRKLGVHEDEEDIFTAITATSNS